MLQTIEEAREAAAAHLRECRLCPRDCRVNRSQGRTGYCRLDARIHCFREMLHPAEEAELSPSHQVYFAGCNLRCGFCTVPEWNEQPLAVRELDADWLIGRIEHRRDQGARNVNLLGGEPTVSLPGILDLLAKVRPATPVVLNSNMYYNGDIDELLSAFVGVYLADLKCGNAECAEALLDARDYVDVARQNIVMASERCDLIVRHLILPGHMDCCLRPTLQWLAKTIPDVKLSLRTNYVPPAAAASAPKEYLGSRDIIAATNEARDLGLRLIE
jgi:putative pyruvate formate lyase activating enzyme